MRTATLAAALAALAIMMLCVVPHAAWAVSAHGHAGSAKGVSGQATCDFCDEGLDFACNWEIREGSSFDSLGLVVAYDGKVLARSEYTFEYGEYVYDDADDDYNWVADADQSFRNTRGEHHFRVYANVDPNDCMSDWYYVTGIGDFYTYKAEEIVNYSKVVKIGVNPINSIVIAGVKLVEGKDYKVTYYAKDMYGDPTAPRGSKPPTVPGHYLAIIDGTGTEDEGKYYNRISFYFDVEAGLADGATAAVGGVTYKTTSDAGSAVCFFKAPKSGKKATVPATVTVNGKTYNVTGIAPKAFKGSKTKTVVVKSTKLTKKSVKGCFKGSKVKTVKVKVGKKKLNKKYVKKYKKIFKKKNSGKKVTVKA